MKKCTCNGINEKCSNCDMDQITTPKAWFERLLLLANNVDRETDIDAKNQRITHIHGYISSAETIIKMK